MEYIELTPLKPIKLYPKEYTIPTNNRSDSYIKKVKYVCENFDIFINRRPTSNIITIGEITLPKNTNLNLKDVLGEYDISDFFIRYTPQIDDNELDYIEVRYKVWGWETDNELINRLYKIHFPN